VHLDSPLSSADPRVREVLRRSLRVAFERLVDLSLAERVDALLIAGDLLDVPLPSPPTQRWLSRQIGRLHEAGTACICVAGNHDPGEEDWSVPGLQRVVGAEPQRLEVRRPGSDRVVGTVTAAGHERARVHENLARRFPVPGSETRVGPPAVALLHAQVDGADDGVHGRYAPCRVTDLQERPYRYWALGHVHRRRQLGVSPECWYAGNLQGRQAREDGAKGALLVTVPEGEAPVRVRFHELAPLRFERVEFEERGRLADFGALQRDLAARLGRRRAEACAAVEDWVLAVKLCGVSPLARELPARWLERCERVDEWQSELAESLEVLEVRLDLDGLRVPRDLDEAARQPDVLGEVLRLLDGLERGDAEVERELWDTSMVGAPIEADARRAYLQALAAGARAELAGRLVDESPS
jgi:DNA repair exonuclease SbcCD nuclease subunit